MTSEPLTSGVVADGLKKLLEAFPRNLGQRNPTMMAEVYKSGLDGIDAHAFRAAVDMCIKQDNFFPKVARLRELAGEWRKRNRAEFAPRIPVAWNTCPVCGARAEAPEITRPKKYGDGQEAHYLTSKEYRSPQGTVIEAGRRIPASTLLDALARGVPLEMETVANPRTVINHDPARHHVRPGEADEYEAAS